MCFSPEDLSNIHFLFFKKDTRSISPFQLPPSFTICLSTCPCVSRLKICLIFIFFSSRKMLALFHPFNYPHPSLSHIHFVSYSFSFLQER
jgi:hypothetical protein